MSEQTGLPIFMCDKCRAKNGDADCPELCDFCTETTLAAWEAHRDKGISAEDMQAMMAQRSIN